MNKKHVIFIVIFSSMAFFGCTSNSKSINSTRAEEYYFEGNKYLEANEIEKAILSFNNAIRIGPEYSLGYSGLGLCYYYKEQYDKAIEYCNKAIEYDKNNEKSYRYLGSIYTTQKDFNRAIECFSQSILIDPNSQSAYVGRGGVYAVKGDTKKAILDFQKAIELDKNDDFSLSALAMLYYNEHSYSKAITYAKMSLEINQNNIFAKNVLEDAERDGISINEYGNTDITVEINIGQTLEEYLEEYPYLQATSLNTLIDNRSSDTGIIFFYYFDEYSHKLKGAACTNDSKNKNQWFNSFLTNWLANKEDIQNNSTENEKVYINLTPIDETGEYKITQFIANNDHYAALCYIIEYY
jgi:tetratricopeptide (TPR) repeat protein